MVKNYYRILKQIKNIRFYKLETLGDISPVFYSPSIFIDENILWKDTIKKLHGAIYQQCDYQVKINGKKKGLFLFSANYSTRNDLKRKFDNVSSLIEDKIIVLPKNTYIKKNMKEVYLLLFIWLFQLRRVKTRIKNKIQYVLELLNAYYNFCSIKSIIDNYEKDLKMVLTYTDIHSIDALVTGYSNYKKIITVTIQHALYNLNPKITGQDCDSSGQITMSRSKYLLAYGPKVKYDARILHYKGHVVPVGSPQNIDNKIEPGFNKKDTDTFLILLDGNISTKEQNKFNVKLIEFGDYIANKYNLNYIVRKHPQDNTKYKITNIKHFLGYSNSKNDISEILNKTDFVIAGNSSAIGELLYYGLLVFRYSYFDEDICYGIWWNSFKNLDGLIDLTGKFLNDKNYYNELLTKTKNALFEKGDVAQNYISFFEKILNK